MEGLVGLTFFQWMLTNFSWAMKVQSGTEHYQKNEKEEEWNWWVGLIQIESKSDKRGQNLQKKEKEKKKLSTLTCWETCSSYFSWFLKARSQVSQKWENSGSFLLFCCGLQSCGHQIAICVSLLCDKSQNWLSLVTFLPWFCLPPRCRS